MRGKAEPLGVAVKIVTSPDPGFICPVVHPEKVPANFAVVDTVRLKLEPANVPLFAEQSSVEQAAAAETVTVYPPLMIAVSPAMGCPVGVQVALLPQVPVAVEV
jgi:hypothetical protein